MMCRIKEKRVSAARLLHARLQPLKETEDSGWEEDNGRVNIDHMTHLRPLVATATMANSAATSLEKQWAELPAITGWSSVCEVSPSPQVSSFFLGLNNLCKARGGVA